MKFHERVRIRDEVMRRRRKHYPIERLLGLLLGSAALCVSVWTRNAVGMTPSAEDEAEYTRVINERADKIVATLGIDDSAKAGRVGELIAGYFRNLREIHDARDAKLDEAKNSPGADPTVAAAWNKVQRDQADQKVNESHRRFVARLSAELLPEQVDKVKDGLTYNVAHITFKQYVRLLPELTDEQKREILASLLEAREYAMDGGSSEEKHAIFGKYKGRINNYMSKAGYDLKAAEKALAERNKTNRE
jgi:hypothetical protein